VSVYTVKRKVMLKQKERQIVLDCLYQEMYSAQMRNSGFATRSSRIAKEQSELEYKNISDQEKLEIYYNFIKQKIIKYIEKDVGKSGAIYWVNGTPEKREARIEEYARYAYEVMHINQRIAIAAKLGYRYLKN